MAAYKRLASMGDTFVLGGLNSPVTLRGVVATTGAGATSLVMSDGTERFATISMPAGAYLDLFGLEVKHGLSASLLGSNADALIIFD